MRTGVSPGGAQPPACSPGAARVGLGGLEAPLQGSQTPELPVCPEAFGRLCKAPCGLAQAPGLAAVHSLCREMVLLGTLFHFGKTHPATVNYT